MWKEVEAARTEAGYLKQTGFTGVTVGAAKNLDKIKEQMGDKGSTFENEFNTFRDNLDASQQDYFEQQIASMAGKENNREAWDAVLERLSGEGIDASEFIQKQ
jgi:hypothetical protein